MFYEEFVLTDNIQTVFEKIKKLNRKALKLNYPPIKFTVTTETKLDTIEELYAGKFFKKTYHYTKIIIEGENPVLSGWSLVAVKDNDPVTGLMIRTVPEKEMPEEFRTTGTPCEHCNSKRVRNQTYILEKRIPELTKDEQKYLDK